MTRSAWSNVRQRLPIIAGYTVAGVSAAVILIGASRSDADLAPGVRVSYAEDLLDRPWRVVGEHGSDRYELRCGKLRVLAERGEIRPYGRTRPKTDTLLAGVGLK